MVVENCVPVHPECHIRYGQTKEMSARCLHYMSRAISAARIGRWYTALWETHGLPLAKGTLPLRGERDGSLLSLLKVGVSLHNRPPLVEYTNDEMLYLFDEGFWFVYMCSVLALRAEEMLRVNSVK